jgi:hypothetical protein
MDDTLMESLEPFDLSQAVDFKTAYLAGFFADRYDVDDSTCADRANSRVRCATENAFNASAFGYDTLITEHSSISLNSAKAKYALLPVWLLFTDYKGKRYTFAMNGQTGKMVGDLPIDKGKYFRELLLTLGITAAAVFLLGLLLWLL